MELKGKVAIVTGGAQRVGRALTLALARAGCDILLHYNASAEQAQHTARESAALGVRVALHAADLAALDAAPRLVELAHAELGPAQILINNAAIFPHDTLLSATPAGWEEVLHVNLRSAIFLTQAFARALPADAPGCVVNIGDWRTERPYLTHFSYGIAKAGLDAFTCSAALELAPRIRVNGIALGAMLPPPGRDLAYLERIAANTPLKRAGGVEVIAEALLFLLANDFITGEIVRLDGGAHLR